MKNKIIQRVLRFMAKLVLLKQKPVVIGITGSVGKTTTKEAIGHVLKRKFRIRSSSKNYNNEIGVALTIIGCDINYNKNKLFQIIGVFFCWKKAIFQKDYPEILVLEMGADKPGDIKYFCDFIPINVGVLTNIGISHLENFKTKQRLAAEKGYLLRSIKNDGVAIFNLDNKDVNEIGQKLSVNKISYGFDSESDMRATDVNLKVEVNKDEIKNDGIIFKLNYQGKVLPVRLNNCMGSGSIYAILAALAVGRYFDLNLIKMIETIQEFKSCQGRITLKNGINNSLIIDDSYNSAPDSLDLALNLVKEIKALRKVVILGDMLELGEEESSSHREVGKKVAQIKPDVFVVVGKRMKNSLETYQLNTGNKKNHLIFNNVYQIDEKIKKLIKPGTLVLVKGSRGMKMERVVNFLTK